MAHPINSRMTLGRRKISAARLKPDEIDEPTPGRTYAKVWGRDALMFDQLGWVPSDRPVVMSTDDNESRITPDWQGACMMIDSATWDTICLEFTSGKRR